MAEMLIPTSCIRNCFCYCCCWHHTDDILHEKRKQKGMMLTIPKNDKKARIIIFSFSLVIFILISALGKYKLNVNLGFDEHLFAKANAVINSIVAVLLLVGLYYAKTRR